MDAVDYQAAFNLAVLVIAGSGGWGMKMLYDAIKSLKQADKELSEADKELIAKIQELELTVAGSIATKADTEKILNKLETLNTRVTDIYIEFKTHVAASVVAAAPKEGDQQ